MRTPGEGRALCRYFWSRGCVKQGQLTVSVKVVEAVMLAFTES